MKPAKSKSILSPGFRYYNAAQTSVSRTFARVRRERAEAERVKAEASRGMVPVVTPIRKVKP